MVSVLVAVSLVMALTFVALAVDAGNGRQLRRQAQAAADGAALAGVQEAIATPLSWPDVVSRVKSYASNDFAVAASAWQGCADPKALAYQPDGGSPNNDQCISADDQSAPSKVRVRIPIRRLPVSFAGVLGYSTLSVSAAATAQRSQTTPCALCVMNPTASKALEVTGSGSITVTNGGVTVNSSAATASSLSGSGNVSALAIGGPGAPASFVAISSGRYSPSPVRLSAAGDPLAGAVTQCPDAGTPTPCPTTVQADVNLTAGSLTINPGIYGTIANHGSGTLTLNPGTYVIKSALVLDGSGGLAATGVTFYFACSGYPTHCPSAGQSGAGFQFAGSGTTQQSAPTSGAFKGLSVSFDPNNTATGSLEGTTSLATSGTYYMKSATLSVQGGGGSASSLVVVGMVSMQGSGNIAINYDAQKNVPVNPLSLLQ